MRAFQHLTKLLTADRACNSSCRCILRSVSWRRLPRTYGTTRRIQAEQSSIEPPDIRKLAKLAQISVTDEEVEDWEPKLREIVGWFNKLQEIDVEGIPPCTSSGLDGLLAAGKDIPHEFENREGLLEEVPDREGPYVKVPKIL